MNIGDGTPNPKGLLAAMVLILAVAGACASPEVSPAAVAPTPGPSQAAVTTTPPATPTQEVVQPSPPVAVPTASALPVPAHWAKTGSMREALGGLQAVKLADGRVLAVGVRVDRDGQPTATAAEIWDPERGTWRETAGLDKVRTDFALVALQDGRALVIGGRNDSDQSFSSAWAFDPSGERWTKVGLMGTARAAPAVAVLPDGRVLVAGGYFAFKPDWGATRDALFSLAAHRVPRPVSDRSPAPLADVDVPPSGRAMATAELFDPRTGQWSSTGSMRYARSGAKAVTLSDGRVLVVGATPGPGGRTVETDWRAQATTEVYDPASGRFSTAGDLSGFDVDPPSWAEGGLGGEVAEVGTLVAVEGGGATLIGHTEWQKHSADFSTSYRFDARDERWSEIGKPFVHIFNGPRGREWTLAGWNLAGAAVATLEDGRVLVAGGGGYLMESETPAVRTARYYDPGTNTWSKAPKLPAGRTGGTGVRLDDGSVLVIGGIQVVRFVPAAP